VDHQSHPLHQKKELLEGDACAACSAVELHIAPNTTLLWDVYGAEGEEEQVEQEEQVHEVDLVEQMKSWKMRMKTLEQCGR